MYYNELLSGHPTLVPHQLDGKLQEGQGLLEAKKKEQAQEKLEDLGMGSTVENTRKNQKMWGIMNGKMG